MRPRTQDARYWSSQSRSLCRRCRADRETDTTDRATRTAFLGSSTIHCVEETVGKRKKLEGKTERDPKQHTVSLSPALSLVYVFGPRRPFRLLQLAERAKTRDEDDDGGGDGRSVDGLSVDEEKDGDVEERRSTKRAKERAKDRTQRPPPSLSLSLSLNSRSGCDQFNLTRECDDGRVSLVAAMAPAVVHARPLLLLSQ